MKKNSALIPALLGIVLGVMLVITVNSIRSKQPRIKSAVTAGRNWNLFWNRLTRIM